MAKHIPRKRFGQNFLVDQQVIADIVAAINPQPDDVVVEIGPGLAAITRPLLARLKQLQVVEIDNDIVARLQKEFVSERLVIHHQDVLKFDFSRVGERFRVVGNLPYNISSPLLFHLAEYRDRIIDMTVMLQQEVVDRMAAAPGENAYGRLSVMLQYHFSVVPVLVVPPAAFNPAPQVMSAVARLVPHPELPWPARDEKLFARVVTAAFGQRRKTLRNSLREWDGQLDWDALGINPQQRAEELGVEKFVAIANSLASP